MGKNANETFNVLERDDSTCAFGLIQLPQIFFPHVIMILLSLDFFLFISWCSQWMTVLFRFFLSFLFSDNFSCIQLVSDSQSALFVSLLFSTHSLLHKAHFFTSKQFNRLLIPANPHSY